MIFNNPERHNAISLEMWQAALGRSWTTSRRRRGARRSCVTGAGDKAFVVGRRHLEVRGRARERGEAVAHYQATTREAPPRARRACAKPTIAMIRGYCIGGGIAVARLLRPAHLHRGRRASASRPRSSASATAATALEPLVDLVGPAFAKEIFFTGRQFTARGGAAAWASSTAWCRRPSSRRTSTSYAQHDRRQRAAHHRAASSASSARR